MRAPVAEVVREEAPGGAGARDSFPEGAIEGTLTDRFRAIAHRYGDRLAVSDGATSLTYAELAALAGSIGAQTAKAAAGKPGPVGILLANDARYPAAMLGVLITGRAFIPLDADAPAERNRQIAQHAGAAAVISAGPGASAATMFGDIAHIDIERLEATPWPEGAVGPRPEDVAWIIYTSGSTGWPKGVYQNHRNCLHDLRQAANGLSLNSEDRLAVVSSPSLISGARNVLSGLMTGASLHILSPVALQPAGLVREIRRRGITVLRMVPALFRLVVEVLPDGERIESVRLVYFSGDRIEWSDVEAVRRCFPPQASLVIALGSTEASTNYAEWIVDPALGESGPRVPAGRPLPDRAVRLVDDDGEPVADGEIGEFEVRSRFVALGYWNDPELTAQTFRRDPADHLSRNLRTGDLGRKRSDGLFEHLGRKDRQIKLRGHRIEPEEIESTLRRCAGVKDAAIVSRGAALVAYCELKPGISGLLPRHIATMAARTLPRTMTPAAIIILEHLPRLANLKIDRVRLAEIDDEGRDAEPHGFDDPTIREIGSVFETILGVAAATPDDNVASLGGDSIQALEILVALELHFGTTIPPELFQTAPSIRDLAEWLAVEKRKAAG